MLSAAALSNTNQVKILELDDELASSLREAVTGHTELDAATFSSDEIDVLTGVLMRLAKIIERRDMSSWMEEDEGGKRSSAWDIICALMERGRLGRKEEEKVSPLMLKVERCALMTRPVRHSHNHIAVTSCRMESYKAPQSVICHFACGRSRFATQAA